MQHSLDEDNEDRNEDKKGKKRKSGILANPNESDIVKTVHFLHKLLDERHVKPVDKSFAKLNFATFCAGELELIKHPGESEEDRQACVDIPLTLCYHYAYLPIEELKTQYDGISSMKSIERGRASWSNSLAERLHNNLAFRATVANREKTSAIKPNQQR